jgi:hypothetical protein
MTTNTTKCDIIRDFVAANACGLCTLRSCSTASQCFPGQACVGGQCVGRPTACAENISNVVCNIPNAANARMAVFADKYNPATLVASRADRAQRELEQRDYASAILATEMGLAAAYPNAASADTNISWPDFERCLHNRRGTAEGAFNDRYFGRADIIGLGMKPVHPIGGNIASGSIWKPPKVSFFSVKADYIANPDMTAILIFVFIIIVFIITFFVIRRMRKNARARAQKEADDYRDKLVAEDPYKDTAFASYPDPAAKCRAYVEKMEAMGYNMRNYRVQCGLPEKP